MHIDATGVPCPDGSLAVELNLGLAVMLLNAEVFDAMAGSSKGRQQLGPAVQQGLAPLRMACPHGEHPALKLEGAAMGSELGAGQAGPVLPDGG